MKKIVLRVVDLMVYIEEAPDDVEVEVHDDEAWDGFVVYQAPHLKSGEPTFLDAGDTEGGTHD